MVRIINRVNRFHILRSVNNLTTPNQFIFVDTESKEKNISATEKELYFHLGYTISWNRETNIRKELGFYDSNDFWKFVMHHFTESLNSLVIFCHNSQFDIKMLNGYNKLFELGFTDICTKYIRANTYILNLFNPNTNQYIFIWDTLNYVHSKLERIGKVLNFPKLPIDFDTTNDIALMEYCKRDTEIIVKFIQNLIIFLLENDLSGLKATIGAIAFNTFRHKFYSSKQPDKRIYIHNKQPAIRMERNSYSGGITDLFFYGYIPNTVYKLDINSMYPDIMKHNKFPKKLIHYCNAGIYNQKQLFTILKNISQDTTLGYILNANITIDKSGAYIINKFDNNKSTFGYGTVNITLCQPEIEFIINNGGSINEIHQIAIYQMDNLFSEYVDYFYDMRKYYKKTNNEVYSEFCKLMLNTLYGKFGQKDIELKQIHKNDKWLKENYTIILRMLEVNHENLSNNAFCYLGKIINDCEVFVLMKQLYTFKKVERNSYDSFVAISSFITSLARMKLIKYMLICNRDNLYYCDTDSLFCNKEGYENLLYHNCINEYELGKLKVEGIGKARFYTPKFYDFELERKAKGIKKESTLLYENDKKAVYQMEYWNKYKTDVKKGTINKQIIRTDTKEISKCYTKGIILPNGKIEPFLIE